MKIIDGGVTAAKGFKAASTAAEIKYKGRTDMAMVFSEVPCVAAGTFTTNVVKAAPVRWDQDIVYNHPGARAVICNSGIANACTGEEGFGLLQGNRQGSIRSLGIPEDSVLVASTGVIGMQLPIDRIANGVKAMAPKLEGSREAGLEAAKAIMTTDTEKKEAAVEIEIGGKTVTVGGMCKGSGMIHPICARCLDLSLVMWISPRNFFRKHSARISRTPTTWYPLTEIPPQTILSSSLQTARPAIRRSQRKTQIMKSSKKLLTT